MRFPGWTYPTALAPKWTLYGRKIRIDYSKNSHDLFLPPRGHKRANILSPSFLRFVAEKAEALGNRQASGEAAMRQFSVGQVVTCLPDRFLRHAAPGNYRIIAAMPDRDGDHIYRIKSPVEEHERVVIEGLLVKSDGYLPDPASRRKSITLPTLRKM